MINRRTGRTTEIIGNALRYAEQGERVYVLFPTLPMAQHSFSNFKDSISIFKDSIAVEINSSKITVHFEKGSLTFSSVENFYFKIIGLNNIRIFTDHTVSEHQGIRIER